jgi:uncharacterized alpha-E superfamily protein
MLSRQASSLYWIGRYQERTEYITRFIDVKYLSTMDSTIIDYQNFVLRSIKFMVTGNAFADSKYEPDILWKVSLDKNAPTSIISYVTAVRENTKGIRNLISNELWEVVNKNYHFVQNFSGEYLKTRGLYEFTHQVEENASLFHAKLESTLLHDNAWAFIKLGIYVERAYQITRILINTLSDIKALKVENENPTVENHQWVTTLNVLEALDMTKKLFKKGVNEDIACEFLITNLDFPRSIASSLDKCCKTIKKIKNGTEINQLDRDSLIYKTAKLAATIKYLDYQNKEIDTNELLSNTLKELAKLNDSIQKEFF